MGILHKYTPYLHLILFNKLVIDQKKKYLVVNEETHEFPNRTEKKEYFRVVFIEKQLKTSSTAFEFHFRKIKKFMKTLLDENLLKHPMQQKEKNAFFSRSSEQEIHMKRFEHF